MPKYVWVAKDGSGTEVVREIVHATAEGAKAELIGEGYTDLKLIEDDVMAAANESFSNKTKFLGEELKVTAEDRVKAMAKPRRSFLNVFQDFIRLNKGLL